MIDSAAIAPIVDTHTHLDDPAFDADRELVIESSRAAGVRHFINIGYSPDRWESSRELGERHADIEFALGLHPQLAAAFDDVLLRALERAIEVMRPIAVGETGLDFSRAEPSFEQQERAFQAQLSVATDAGLPIIVHQRDASDALIDLLDQWPTVAPIVLHSFDGSDRLADWARDRGCFLGIGGLATRRSSESLRNSLARISVDRLLLETDSPYLAPPGSPSRRNSPANLPEIAMALSPLWGLSGEELCRLTSRNADSLFGLPPVDGPL
ncbi:MAG TPA: TatD family hydrolase [Thermomicrobiales bacterium]|nr:TatD family hydrolase [Thermomicrobiales bacterium]